MQNYLEIFSPAIYVKTEECTAYVSTQLSDGNTSSDCQWLETIWHASLISNVSTEAYYLL